MGVRARDSGEVDDPGARRVQPGDSARVRLERFDAVRVDPAQTRYPVGLPAPLQLIEPAQLGGVGRDDHLPARLVGDSVLLAVLVQLARALDAQPRLQRAGRVVDARVNHPRVVTRLMGADRASRSSTHTDVCG